MKGIMKKKDFQENLREKQLKKPQKKKRGLEI